MQILNIQRMENIDKLPDFITNYFIYEGNQFKMAAVPEMIPSRSGLDFTGNYIGIYIIANNGTMLFERDQHPDKYWKCDKQPLESAPPEFSINFTFRTFTYDGEIYKVVLTYEMGRWEEDEGLDFTGCFEGILISEKTGTLAFTLLPDAKKVWECEYHSDEPIDRGLTEMLGNFAKEIKEGILVPH